MEICINMASLEFFLDIRRVPCDTLWCVRDIKKVTRVLGDIKLYIKGYGSFWYPWLVSGPQGYQEFLICIFRLS